MSIHSYGRATDEEEAVHMLSRHLGLHSRTADAACAYRAHIHANNRHDLPGAAADQTATWDSFAGNWLTVSFTHSI